MSEILVNTQLELILLSTRYVINATFRSNFAFCLSYFIITKKASVG